MQTAGSLRDDWRSSCARSDIERSCCLSDASLFESPSQSGVCVWMRALLISFVDFAMHTCISQSQHQRVLYVWVAHNIEHDTTAMFQGKKAAVKPDAVLTAKRAQSEGFAQLFAALCGSVAIRCTVVTGSMFFFSFFLFIFLFMCRLSPFVGAINLQIFLPDAKQAL